MRLVLLKAGSGKKSPRTFATVDWGNTEHREHVCNVIRPILEGVKGDQGLDAWWHPDEGRLFLSWGDWADREVYRPVNAELQRLFGEDGENRTGRLYIGNEEIPGPHPVRDGWKQLVAQRQRVSKGLVFLTGILEKARRFMAVHPSQLSLFDESAHPRTPAGGPHGGEFAAKPRAAAPPPAISMGRGFLIKPDGSHVVLGRNQSHDEWLLGGGGREHGAQGDWLDLYRQGWVAGRDDSGFIDYVTADSSRAIAAAQAHHDLHFPNRRAAITVMGSHAFDSHYCRLENGEPDWVRAVRDSRRVTAADRKQVHVVGKRVLSQADQDAAHHPEGVGMRVDFDRLLDTGVRLRGGNPEGMSREEKMDMATEPIPHVAEGDAPLVDRERLHEGPANLGVASLETHAGRVFHKPDGGTLSYHRGSNGLWELHEDGQVRAWDLDAVRVAREVNAREAAFAPYPLSVTSKERARAAERAAHDAHALGRMGKSLLFIRRRAG